MSTPRRAGAVFAILIAAVTSAAHASTVTPYDVHATTHVATDGVGITDPHSASSDTGVVYGATSVAADSLSVASSGMYYDLAATARARAEVGALHGSVTTSFGTSGPGSGASASAFARWDDTLRLTSSTGASGFVDVLATLTFHRTVSSSNSSGYGDALLQLAFGSIDINDDLQNRDFDQSVTKVISLPLNYTFNIYSTLNLSIGSQGTSTDTSHPHAGSAEILADNTSVFSLELPTGVSLTSSSGATFAPPAAAPTPSAAAAACALLPLTLLARRRTPRPA